GAFGGPQVEVAVAADLVAGLGDLPHPAWLVLGHLSEDEEGRGAVGFGEHLQELGQQPIQLLTQRRPALRVHIPRDQARVVPLLYIYRQGASEPPAETGDPRRVRRHRASVDRLTRGCFPGYVRRERRCTSRAGSRAQYHGSTSAAGAPVSGSRVLLSSGGEAYGGCRGRDVPPLDAGRVRAHGRR